MAKHYDVVVLGAGMGALSAAALLARRSWRVLVLGQGARPQTYTWQGLPLARRPFTFLAGASPVWKRILIELAQSQAFRRRLRVPDPMFQVLEPRFRISIPADAQLLGRELDRELSEVRRVVDELHAELIRANTAADAAFDQDVVWSPGTFWERRETARAADLLPYRRERERDLLAELPKGHTFRTIAGAPTSFGTNLSPPIPPLAFARVYGAWSRAVLELARGEDEMTEFLVDRVRAHGADVVLGARASEIIARSSRATGVRIDGEDEVTGVQFVVTDLPSSALLDLTPAFRPPRRALDERPRAEVEAQRFVTSFLVRDEGVPQPLASESFLVHPTPDGLTVHLQRMATATPGTTLLIAEVIVGPPERFDARERRRVRAAVATAVERYLPYIERHYLLVDSPHDGLPLWDFRSGSRVLVERVALRASGGSPDAEPMRPLLRVDVPPAASSGGLEGELLRYPLGGTFGVGDTIFPALGQEGELLAAWGAARVITRTDRHKEKMRREMWSKVELG